MEVRYRDPHAPKIVEVEEDGQRVEVEEMDEEEPDILQAMVEGVEEVTKEGPGDVLVFLSGEREIRETAEALEEQFGNRRGDFAAVRAAELGGAAAGFCAGENAADRAGDERGGDEPDGAGDPVRGGPGAGADIAVFAADEGAAVADRAGVAGVGEPADGAVRAGGGGGMRAAVFGGEFFGAARCSPSRRFCGRTWRR